VPLPAGEAGETQNELALKYSKTNIGISLGALPSRLPPALSASSAKKMRSENILQKKIHDSIIYGSVLLKAAPSRDGLLLRNP